MEEKAVSLTPSQLQELLMTMAAELRRPPDPTPEQLAQIENDKAARRAQAELVLRQMENKRNQQLACTHARSNGSTCMVYVQNLNLMICQHCQALVYPEGQNGVPWGFYNTPLFNKHFQLYADAVGNV